MLELAICDDSECQVEELERLLDSYGDERHRRIKYDSYLNAIDLIDELQNGRNYDLIIMGIVMPGLNGIDAAKEIRALDASVRIIFLTSSPDFALQSYAVGAFAYQLKPVRRDRFFGLLDRACAELGRERKDSLLVKTKNGLTRMALEELEYCEILGKTVCFHLSSGRVLESIGNMEQLSEILTAHEGFIRAHRSYEINLDYITDMSYKMVRLSSGKEIPLPRGKYGEIKEIFLARAFQNGWMVV